MLFRAEDVASRPDSGIEKADIYLPPVIVELEVAAGVPKLPYRFISAFGSDMGVYVGSDWLVAVAPAKFAVAGEVEDPAVLPLSMDVSAFAVAGLALAELAVPADILSRVWLIDIS